MSAKSVFLLLIIGLSIAGAAHVQAAEFDAVRAKQAQISAQVLSGKPPYDGISAQTRAALLERQAALLKLIDGKRGPEELDPQQHVEFEELLQWIDSATARAEDSRQVCELRKMLGSNRKERVCTTVGQQREQREAARRQLESSKMR